MVLEEGGYNLLGSLLAFDLKTADAEHSGMAPPSIPTRLPAP